MGYTEWDTMKRSYWRWARDVPRVARVDCLVTLFVDDLVCIPDALAQVSSEGRVRWRDGREEGEERVCWECAERATFAAGPSAPTHSPAVMPRWLPNSKMDEWRVSRPPLNFPRFTLRKSRRFTFLAFCGRDPRMLVNSGTSDTL